MKTASLAVCKDFAIGETSDRLFGSFVEHMGSVVYGGVFEPGHPAADEHGFRRDVLGLVRSLGLSAVRYPGGNYSSAYDWEDSVGPVERRPRRLDLAWRAYEPNAFGLHEFMEWARLAGVSPIFTVNLGTRGVDEARKIVEYCNLPTGSEWSDLRAANGSPKPFGVRTWCLGNELDGPWQMGSKTAEEYGRLAFEAGKAMKQVDPSIELVAVGSSQRKMPTFGEWDRTVLMRAYEQIDYLALHNYCDKRDASREDYFAMPQEFALQIDEIIATCDHVKAVRRSPKTMKLCFDEWNVHKSSVAGLEYEPMTTGSPIDWCQYNMEDTLVFASILLAIMRRADRVGISCQSLLVNTIPLILAEKGGSAWLNAIAYPMMHASRFGRGTVLRAALSSPLFSSSNYGELPLLDPLVVLSRDGRELTVFAVNKADERMELKLGAGGFGELDLIDQLSMSSPDMAAVNSAAEPEAIVPAPALATVVNGSRASSVLEPYSWNVVRFRVS